ncbi:hypothetical protein ACFZ8E_27335 [Methylobacterium sp. HMF5984]|uniref:hypothetical protein n=1 Tax=Methylobacterium sp. HMF5984 TaxID=3367370 RepID=UPI0038550576
MLLVILWSDRDTQSVQRQALGAVRLDTLAKRYGPPGDCIGIASATGAAATDGLTVGRVLAGRTWHRGENKQFEGSITPSSPLGLRN